MAHPPDELTGREDSDAMKFFEREQVVMLGEAADETKSRRQRRLTAQRGGGRFAVLTANFFPLVSVELLR